MRQAILLSVLLFGLVSGSQALEYPVTASSDQVDDYHGEKVADPFRWLEDDVRESKQVSTWVGQQNVITQAYLETLNQRGRIKERLSELWNYERFGAPFKAGDHYFYFRNDGLQNQFVLYCQTSLDGPAKIVVDPNTWSADGTVALSGTSFSEDGRYLAYGIQDGGSDWRTWRVMDLNRGQLLDDKLEWLKFTSVAWNKDASGFYYSRYPKTKQGEQFQSLNLNQKVYFHKLGTDQAEDQVVYARPDHPDWGFAAEVSKDGNYLLIYTWIGTDDRNRVDIQRLDKPGSSIQPLVDDFSAAYALVANKGQKLYFRTTENAPKAKLVSIDLAAEQPAWVDVIPETENVLTGVDYIGGRFVASYLKDARSQLKVFDRSGSLQREVDLPGIGSVNGLNGDPDSPEAFFVYSSYNQPPAAYRYDVASGAMQAWKTAEVAFDPDNYVVKQVFYKSKDGTAIPMFITHRKDLQPDGRTPTLLYGYGGFNISLQPRFDTSRLGWLDMGGIYAVANLRGGGEYGEAWHKAGTKLQKQNVFDDFIAAAEYLIKENYTSPKHLAVYGRSNGGLLVGATINQRPDLFAAALPAVGVMDMLRFQNFTAGRFWTDDYGSSQNPDEFKALRAYSPYHNIDPNKRYPATLVTTADTDDRVVPGHSFKYIARLQQAQTANASPMLIRIETRAGHGAGKPTAKIIEEYTDMWAFIAHHTGLTLRESYGAEK